MHFKKRNYRYGKPDKWRNLNMIQKFDIVNEVNIQVLN